MNPRKQAWEYSSGDQNVGGLLSTYECAFYLSRILRGEGIHEGKCIWSLSADDGFPNDTVLATEPMTTMSDETPQIRCDDDWLDLVMATRGDSGHIPVQSDPL